MIEQQARIIQVEGGRALVSVGPRGGCSACDAGQGCGAGLFGRMLRRKPLTLTVPNPDGHGVGQPVLLGIPELFYLRLVLRLYAWPLAGGLAAAWICHQIGVVNGLGRGVTDLLSLAGLVGGAWWVIALQKKALGDTGYEQHIEMKAAPASVCRAGKGVSRREDS